MFSRRSITSFLLSTTLLMGLSATAHAQDMEDFKARMAQASEMTKSNMSEALRLYLETRIQYAGPEIDYSLGRTYQRLYQCSQAQQYYIQVMVNYDLGPDNPIYSRAVSDYDTIADCESWQQVTISCTKASDDILSIDDQKMTECWDRPYSLPDGEHEIKLISAKGPEKSLKFTAKAGSAPQHLEIAFPLADEEEKTPTLEQCAAIIPRTKIVEYKERFNPYLYWGLIAGGLAFVAGGAGFGAWANSALVDVQKYDDMYIITNDLKAKSKADDARDTVKVANALMYSAIGIGGAAAITGATLAILSAISPKVAVETYQQNDVSAFVAPSNEGLMLGLGMTF